MNTYQKGKRICCICGVKGKKKGYDLPGLIFNYLEGDPCICEKCLFTELTCRHPETSNGKWKDDIKQNLKEK